MKTNFPDFWGVKIKSRATRFGELDDITIESPYFTVLGLVKKKASTYDELYDRYCEEGDCDDADFDTPFYALQEHSLIEEKNGKWYLTEEGKKIYSLVKSKGLSREGTVNPYYFVDESNKGNFRIL